MRVTIAGCIFPRRSHRDETEYNARKARSAARVVKTIDAEIDWILRSANEPDWPKLPPAEPKIRHGIHFGGEPTLAVDEQEITDVEEVIPNPDNLFFAENSVALIVMVTTPAVRSSWLLDFLDVY